MRKLPTTLVGAGVVLVAGAGALHFAVAPYALDNAQLKSDTDVTRTYTGTATTLLDQSTMKLLTNVPMTFTHQAKVVSTSGDTAIVQDTRKAIAPGGTVVANIPMTYSVDRHTMMGAPVPAGVTAIQPSGSTFSFPIDTQQKDYQGYVAENGSSTTAKYVRTETHGGIQTYVFTSSVQVPLNDAMVKTMGLPTALPKAVVAGLVPAALKNTFQQIFPSLPAMLPMSYGYADTSTYWVEPITGVVVDLQRHETRTVTAKLGTLPAPPVTILDATYQESPAELAAAVSYAQDQRSAYDLVNGTLPLALVIAGGVALLAGGALFLRRKPEAGIPSAIGATVPAPRGAGETIELEKTSK